MAELSDETLYLRFLEEQDEALFRELLLRHQNSLIYFLYGYVHSYEDAEELMIDTFAIAASGTTRFVPGRNAGFRTWLFAIAKNRARMHLRRHKPVFEEIREDLPSKDPLPEMHLASEEQRRQLYGALNSLAADYRQVLYLLYFEGMKPEEIGSVMGKTIKQIYNLTNRGKAALRESLERMGFEYAQFG
ncbi:MAG: sigma-70 family RNA polymerase sigma factor [Lachnospiraceae bacterium]|nr:sigma-70 family RNA polymerase sigma factor [Lachnospiraceae bacterium]